jgi:UDP-galactopyranose mutase
MSQYAADYVIVGTGLTGAVIARSLADAGREVLLLERRDHVGGNVHDHVHPPSGIRIHTYGPHYFRTSSDRIWEFVNRFASFYKYEAALKTRIDGVEENWPIAASYIATHIGESWQPQFVGEPRNFEEAALSLMPQAVYEKFIKPYNEKQWGVPAKQLAARLCRRFDVRMDDEPRLMPDRKYQGIPTGGYAAMMTAMLDGLPCKLGVDFTQVRGDVKAKKKLIFTGPIDTFFDCDAGKLAYRGQQREHRYLPDVEQYQSCGQVNSPQHEDGPAIRTLEWKHMMPPSPLPQVGQRPGEGDDVQVNACPGGEPSPQPSALKGEGVRGTVITTETPYTPGDPSGYEYPFPDEANDKLYAEYRKRADALDDVLICGRLGEYRYYDMDQAIGRAMMLAEGLREDR